MRSLFILIAIIFFAVTARTTFTAQAGPAAYGADGSTRLFESFEGPIAGWKSESTSVDVSIAAGYLGGQAMFLGDTDAHAVFSDSWWARDISGDNQDSGTIEFYYRPETFIFTQNQRYGLLLTQEEHKNPSVDGQRPNLGILEAGIVTWSISSPPGHTEIRSDEAETHPALYPGQWYHIAVTWDSSVIRLYINGTLAGEKVAPLVIDADTFFLGSTNRQLGQGLAARGRIDYFRLSSKVRAPSEFPEALNVVITSPNPPAGGETVTKPFLVSYRASSSDTRPRLVDLYVDTDRFDFNGTRIASNLSEAGTATIFDIADSTYFLYAVVRAGTDSAFFYTTNPIHVVTASSFSVTQLGGGPSDACLLTRLEMPGLAVFRGMRDAVLNSRVGRILTRAYYEFSR